MIYRYLSAGTYYVKINNYYLQYAGTYSINVVSVLAWGGISGRVTDASGVGIQGIQVEVWGMDYSQYYGCASTDVRGNYMYSGPYRALATGSYKVYFHNIGLNYSSEWYNDKSSIDTADQIAVISGGNTQNIDAQLAAGNQISGRVTNASGVGIKGIEALVFDLNDEWMCRSYADTDADGNYTVFGLPAGNLKIWFYNNGKNYVSEWYDKQSSYATADQVIVTAGIPLANINAQLKVGGIISNISGRVTDGSGVGIRHIWVNVVDLDYKWWGDNLTDADGNYAVVGLPSGKFKVFFNGDIANYISEWYNNKNDFASADPVTVTAGSTTSHINVGELH
jgi:hypothetical protein